MIEGFENDVGAVVEVETDTGWLRIPALALLDRPGGFAFVTPAYFGEDSNVRSGHRIDAVLSVAGDRIEFVGPAFSGWVERHDGREFADLTSALETLKARGMTQDELREKVRPQLA